ncbi:aspartate--tRNA ligase [soil metagenome]
MTDQLATRYRTSVAGSLRSNDIEASVRLVGWVHRRRDLGGLVFLDLRDRGGLVQISFDPEWSPADLIREARALGPEDVVQVVGTVFRRIRENPELPSGEIEVRAVEMKILNRADPLPIPVYRTPDEELPSEELRLRYRYLDLRRPELQRNFLLRHRAARAIRAYLDSEGFVEIETPMLTRRTPEGARDYLVPSRVHPGEFYALPQSPQLYKQLLMVSGMDRYYQIVRCLRDEDLRADRQPEFTQIDAEMSFVDEEDVFAVGEGMIAALWRGIFDIDLPVPFARLTHAEALGWYGTDKPDLRFDLRISELTHLLQRSDFRLFSATASSGQLIRGFRVPGGASLSRRELDDLQEVARAAGGSGALWVKLSEDGWAGQFAKAIDQNLSSDLRSAMSMEPGDLLVVVVGSFRTRHPDEGTDSTEALREATGETFLEPVLDELRRHLARKLDLVDQHAHAWLWVTDFPLFDWDAESGRLVSAHHPFTMPHEEDVSALLQATEQDGPVSPETAGELFRGGLRSRAYDAVYNGNELASGSVRIHDSELQRRIFRALGLGPEEAREKFGFLLEAFRYGAPPHAGFAFGFDRLVMLMANAASLRDVIAFPKTTAGRALFEGAPSPLDARELAELHIRSTATENQ